MREEIEAVKDFWNDTYKDAKAEVLGNDKFTVINEMKPIFNKFLNECSTILDYGFGCANLLMCAAHDDRTNKCYGIENGANIISYGNQMVECNKLKDKVILFDGGINALSNFDNNSIEGVIISNVLDVITEEVAQSILVELLRVLKPNGLVMLKLNQYLSYEECIKGGLVKISNNLYSENGIVRLRSVPTNEWRKYLSQYFIEEMYSDVPYQTADFYDRLFLLRKK